MKVVVIGSGSIGQRHFRNLVTLGIDASLIPYREYFPDVLNDCDGVVIATATNIRVNLISDAVKRDLPIYVEKPLVFRSEDINLIERLVVNVANRSMLGYMMRYHPAFRVMADMDFSDTYAFTFNIGHDVNKWRKNWTFSKSYASKSNGGGVLLDLCHEIDMANVIFPGLSIKDVDSVGSSLFPGVDFCSRILVESQTKVQGSIGMDYLAPQLHRRTQILGRNTMYDFDYASQSFQIKDSKGTRRIELPNERNDMFLEIMSDWVSIIAGEAENNRLAPRLDRVFESVKLISDAWEARKFRHFYE